MPPSQITMDFQSPPSNDRTDFVLGACNALAADWIDRWPDWPGRISGLVLIGPEASGKSHLASIWQTMSSARVMTSLDDRSIFTLDECKHIIWDNFEASANWPDDLMFHFLNRLTELQGSLLILSRRPMAEMQFGLDDVASRLNGLSSAVIDTPDDDVLTAVLHKLADDLGLALDPEVTRYIVSRINRSFLTAQQIITALNKVTLAEQRKLTVPLARDVMDEHGFMAIEAKDY